MAEIRTGSRCHVCNEPVLVLTKDEKGEYIFTAKCSLCNHENSCFLRDVVSELQADDEGVRRFATRCTHCTSEEEELAVFLFEEVERSLLLKVACSVCPERQATFVVEETLEAIRLQENRIKSAVN